MSQMDDKVRGKPLITRRSAEIAVKRLLRWAQGKDLTTVVTDDGVELRSFVDTGRLGSVKAILEQWRWEQDRPRTQASVDHYERMSDAELMQETREAEALLVEETRQ